MNREIKEKMKAANVYQWQVAKLMNVSEATMCRWLRDDPLPAERLERSLKAIEKLSNKEATT